MKFKNKDRLEFESKDEDNWKEWEYVYPIPGPGTRRELPEKKDANPDSSALVLDQKSRYNGGEPTPHPARTTRAMQTRCVANGRTAGTRRVGASADEGGKEKITATSAQRSRKLWNAGRMGKRTIPSNPSSKSHRVFARPLPTSTSTSAALDARACEIRSMRCKTNILSNEVTRGTHCVPHAGIGIASAREPADQGGGADVGGIGRRRRRVGRKPERAARAKTECKDGDVDSRWKERQPARAGLTGAGVQDVEEIFKVTREEWEERR
ncbi:hypothetical protein B0H13DRAFT_1877806 [Mycena leptocephala]|nr:hypothetical protein B0H13DRAFT_1877806 [Mycena leptocephala]